MPVIACGMKEVLGMQRKRENGCFRTAVEACLDIDFGQDTQLEDVGAIPGRKKKVEGQLARWAPSRWMRPGGLQWVCIWVSAMASGFSVGVGAAFD